MSETFSRNFDSYLPSNTERDDTGSLQRMHSEIGDDKFNRSDTTKAQIAATEIEVQRNVLPRLELITNSDQSNSTDLPEGIHGTLVFEDDFTDSNNWCLGIQNTSGRGAGPDNVWHGDQGFTASDAAVTFGTDGLSITADASKGTFGEISSKNPVGGDGKPYYIQFTMTGGEDWPGVWLLPVDGKHGAKEIDLQEGNMPGHDSAPAQQSLNAAYHWDFKDITQQVLLVHDTGVNVNTTSNTYGALVEADQVTIFFNGEKVGVLKTDNDNLDVPMTIIVDNYLWPGSADWHADNVPGPTTMNMTNMQVYTIDDSVQPQPPG